MYLLLGKQQFKISLKKKIIFKTNVCLYKKTLDAITRGKKTKIRFKGFKHKFPTSLCIHYDHLQVNGNRIDCLSFRTG